MPTYVYRAVDLESTKTVEGTIEAPDDRHARLNLRARGIVPLAVHLPEADFVAMHPAVLKLVGLLTYRKVKPSELAIYTQQLAALIDAGLPIIEVFVTLEEQTFHPTLRRVTAEIRKDLLGGLMLSEAMQRHPRVFGPLFINLVSAGERSGALEIMLGRLSETMEKNLDIQRKVTQALTYPALVGGILVVVVSVLLVFVVPSFKTMYSRSKATLPLPTQILLAMSDALQHDTVAIVGFVVMLLVAYRWYRNTAAGRIVVDRLWLQLPIVGPLLLEQAANTFTRAFGTVYGAGIPVVSALESCRRVVSNAAMAEVLESAENQVRQGHSLAVALGGSPYFPKILAQMIAIGESSGKIEEVVARAVAFSDKDVDFKIRQMTTMLEPLLTVVIGVVVMFIALAMYLPMFELPKLLGHH